MSFHSLSHPFVPILGAVKMDGLIVIIQKSLFFFHVHYFISERLNMVRMCDKVFIMYPIPSVPILGAVEMEERNKLWIWIDHIVVYVAGVKVTFTRVQYASWWYWVLDFDVVLVTVSVWTMSWWSNYQAEDNELSMTVNINIGLFKTSLHFSPLQFWLILWGIF